MCLKAVLANKTTILW